MKKSIVTRRTFLSATTATALSGLLRPVLPGQSRTLAAPPHPSSEPRYLGKSLPQLVQELSSLDNRVPGSGDVRRKEKNLVDALACFGLASVPALEITMREGSPKAREVAVRVLGGMVPVAIPHLVAALKDEDLQVQAAAAFFLAAMPPQVPLDSQVMGFLLDVRRPQLLKATVAAWAAFGNTPGSAVPALTKLLRERKIAAELDALLSDTPDFSARIDLLKALGNARPPRSMRCSWRYATTSPPYVWPPAEILTDVARDDVADSRRSSGSIERQRSAYSHRKCGGHQEVYSR